MLAATACANSKPNSNSSQLQTQRHTAAAMPGSLQHVPSATNVGRLAPSATIFNRQPAAACSKPSARLVGAMVLWWWQLRNAGYQKHVVGAWHTPSGRVPPPVHWKLQTTRSSALHSRAVAITTHMTAHACHRAAQHDDHALHVPGGHQDGEHTHSRYNQLTTRMLRKPLMQYTASAWMHGLAHNMAPLPPAGHCGSALTLTRR